MSETSPPSPSTSEGPKDDKPAKTRKGLEDRGNFGLLGLTAGMLGAFALSFYVVLPALMTDASMNTQTLVTIVSLGLMILGGGAGYYFTRRPVGPAGGPSA